MGSSEVSASDVEPPGDKLWGKTDHRTAILLLTLALTPILWGVAFGISLLHEGTDVALASSKATVHVVYSLVGWATILWMLRPLASLPPWTLFLAFVMIPSGAAGLLGQTRGPWPFREILIRSLVASTLNGVMFGLIFRFCSRRFLKKNVPKLSVHPLSDDQIDSPT